MKQLSEMSSQELWRLFPIIITEYNPKWPELYESERSLIVEAIGASNRKTTLHHT